MIENFVTTAAQVDLIKDRDDPTVALSIADGDCVYSDATTPRSPVSIVQPSLAPSPALTSSPAWHLSHSMSAAIRLLFDAKCPLRGTWVGIVKIGEMGRLGLLPHLWLLAKKKRFSEM